MRAHVLVFVEDPGAANGVLGLREELHRRGLAASVIVTGPAVAFMRDRNETFDPLPDELADESSARAVAARALLDHHRPDVILVGTSENPDTLGLHLVDEGRRRGVPTAAFVDAYPNASFRFRGLGPEPRDPLAHCPDVVLVPDEWTRGAFAALGVATDRTVVTGHPHYDRVLAAREELEREGQPTCRRRVFPDAPDGARIIMFAAEINGGFDAAQFQRSAAYTLHGRGARHGRTDIVLEELLDAVEAARPRVSERLHVVLRLHPKNTREELEPLASEAGAVSRGGSALDAAFASDVVVGMTSTILIEAALLGRETLSIVPRPQEREWLPTARAGLTPCATTRQEVRRAVAEWAGGASISRAPSVERGAVRRIAEVLESTLSWRTK